MPKNTLSLIVLGCILLTGLALLYYSPQGIWESWTTDESPLLDSDGENYAIDGSLVLKDDVQSGQVAALSQANKQNLVWVAEVAKEINKHLLKNHPTQAVKLIDDIYQQASAEELAQFKQIILRHADQLGQSGNDQRASVLLESYAQTFDDVDAWRGLANSFANLKNWPKTVTALLHASALEYQPDALAATLQALVRASSHVRASLERQGDELSILALYQRLYDRHPDYARFQLELAQSHLRLGNPDAAKPYLEALQYDSDLGTLAQQKLAALEEKTRTRAKVDDALTDEQLKQINSSNIVVPLVRTGDSFLVDVSINSRPLRLLLDTGASITALSTAAIAKLNLPATGRYIQLSTANGTLRSQLYQAKRIRIGQLNFESLLIAEIDMQHANEIQGLLGTDLLNQLNSRYSYVIDNQKNALIFKRK